MPIKRVRCPIEEGLPPEDALELDLLLADTSRWPKSVFEGWKLPAGSVPSTMRTWGAIEVGLSWCREHGYDFSKIQMQHHYDRHVPILAATPDDLVARAATGTGGRSVIPAEPTTYLDLYVKGIGIGGRALDLLNAKLDRLIAQDKDIPTELLLQIGKLGTQLATSQAGIVSRGFDLARQKEEELEGFRAGSAPAASPRFGDHRIRVIEGEARPVVDRGRADRMAYNETADQDGSPRLPA